MKLRLRHFLQGMFSPTLVGGGIILAIWHMEWRFALFGVLIAGVFEGILAIERALRVDDPGCHRRRGSM